MVYISGITKFVQLKIILKRCIQHKNCFHEAISIASTNKSDVIHTVSIYTYTNCYVAYTYIDKSISKNAINYMAIPTVKYDLNINYFLFITISQIKQTRLFLIPACIPFYFTTLRKFHYCCISLVHTYFESYMVIILQYSKHLPELYGGKS